jgi:hypothetical protein
MRQKLGWQRHLHHHSKRRLLMATKKAAKPEKPTKPERDKDAICQAVLQGMRDGLSAFKACQEAGVPQSTFNRWVDADAKLAEDYAHAREDLIERMAQEVLELADSDVPETGEGKKDWQAIQKHKLQVDTRKWLLSKLAPKKYGDRLELAGDKENPLQVQTIDASKLSTDVLAQIIAAKDHAADAS